MSDGLEKREFQRLEYPLEVTVEIVCEKEVSNSLPPLQFKSRNISKGGIYLETKAIEVGGINLLSGHPFARKYRLSMNVELFPDEQQFGATGEVRWYDVSRDIPEYIYRVGVAFIDIKNNGKEQLLRFLKDHKSNKGYFHKLFNYAISQR